MKRSGHGLLREVSRSGARCSGFLKNTELVKIISTITNTNLCLLSSFVSSWRAPLQHLRGVKDARGLRGVVGGINSDHHASCVHSTMVLSSFCRETNHSLFAFIKDFSGMDMLCSDKTDTLTQYVITIESKLPWCETSEQVLLSFALLVFEWTQNAKDVIDTMLLKCKQEVQADLGRHTSHLLAFRSCCRDDRVHCCGLLSQSCGDQGRCGCASVVAC